MSVGAVNKQTGDRIPTAGMPAIDDALDLTSVNPVQNAVITAALANKQDKTDNNLETTAKTIVGAINEHEGDISSLKSGLTNVQTAVESGNIVEVGTDEELAALLYNKKNYKKSFLLKDSTKTMSLLNKYDTTYAYVTFYSSEHVWDNHPDYTGNFGTHIICGAVVVTSTTIGLIQTFQAVTENVM